MRHRHFEGYEFSMPVLLMKYCPICRAKTYQYYRTPYRSDFVNTAHWECAECGTQMDNQGKVLKERTPSRAGAPAS